MTAREDVESGTQIEIEVWSDVVCPWCYIGKRRLDQALADHAGRVRIVHRAFQLDPGARTEGRSTIEVLAEKYRTTREQARSMMSQVTAVAAELGLDYRLDETVSGNTLDAHRLLLWAQEQGLAQELLEALYAGYFTEGRPIFSADELLPFAIKVGLDGLQARAILASDEYAVQARLDQQVAADLGANGVPFFVLDRRIGISGAQPLEVFRQALANAGQGA
jgi:predicted DsbA family dithiol-disulfide isomerase